MANVLGTLFGEIANAIREKSGESGTMKPAEFPDKISQIVTGGGGSGELKYKTGYVSRYSMESIKTFSHNMGVVPDIIILYSEEPPVENTLFFTIGFSSAMIKAFGNEYATIGFALITNTSMSTASNVGFESDTVKTPLGDGYGLIHSVNTSTFKAGGTTWPLAIRQYGWIAISGITG